MITTLTIKGIDDTTSPNTLVRLSESYPFLEWGINVNRSNFMSSQTRFHPSTKWIKEMSEKALAHNIKMALYYSGYPLKRFLLGQETEYDLFNILAEYNCFRRVHFDTKGEDLPFVINFSDALPKANIMYSFEGYNSMMDLLFNNEFNVAVLFPPKSEIELYSKCSEPLAGIPNYGFPVLIDSLPIDMERYTKIFAEKLKQINFISKDTPVWAEINVDKSLPVSFIENWEYLGYMCFQASKIIYE